jgi:hypothetical protein
MISTDHRCQRNAGVGGRCISRSAAEVAQAKLWTQFCGLARRSDGRRRRVKAHDATLTPARLG